MLLFTTAVPIIKPREEKAITKKLNVPADVVWPAIRNIGRLDVWFLIIQSCRVEDEGQGASRYMTIANSGGEIKDSIEEIDDSKMRLVYLRPVSPFPVTYSQDTVEMFSYYDGLGIVVWTIEFESKPEDVASVAELVHGAISARLEGMEKDLQRLGEAPC
ncbi:MAG: SRPBCC family protein [Methylococcales bacterium]|nr:SRPBCC family protein [Methylococcales bacterium]